MGNAPGKEYSQNRRRREYAARYLAGDGIEIGGLHNPLDLSGLPVTRIRRVDRYDNTMLREHYAPLHAEEFVAVDIIDDGQVLGSIADASLDFIVANHLIEHCDNPLGTLENWLAKLKPGGIIFMAVPDQRVGFEERRPLTPLDHIVEDYRSSAETRTMCNRDHYGEWVDYFTAAFPTDSPLTREERIHQLIATDYSIHFHVFTFESFREMIVYARDELGFPLNLADTGRPMWRAWESLFILAKCAPETLPARRAEADPHAGATITQLEERWQADQIELEHSDLIIEHLRTRLAETEAQIGNMAVTARMREATLAADRDQALAAKNEYILSLEARLDMIEREVLPWKESYIASLEGHVRSLDASTAMRATHAVRRLLGTSPRAARKSRRSTH